MPYLSRLIGKSVRDTEGERIGVLRDLVASMRPETPHPEIVAALVRTQGEERLLPYSDLAVLVAPAVSLARPFEEIVPFAPTEREVYLARDILDKQMIDVNDARVVRVNDIELVRVKGRYYVANVDIGALGLLRRLGLARAGRQRRPGYAGGRPSSISWENLELLPANRQLRLKVPSSKIKELHPADLAEVISDLSRSEGTGLLESLDVETVAETLEEIEPDFQASLVKSMPDEKVADILEEMAPDEAADLLAELPEQRSQDLLKLMEDKDAREVRKLLAYPEDSAGGVMTTEFLTIRPELTAQKAIATLRQTANEAETIYYVYVTDRAGRLQGVCSLKDLVLAEPRKLVREFMEERFVSVGPLASQEEVARMVAKYNLLAVPVVDDQGRLQGIVTADDALDKIIPTAWKKRLPRMYY
jgi:magnesium transporter